MRRTHPLVLLLWLALPVAFGCGTDTKSNPGMDAIIDDSVSDTGLLPGSSCVMNGDGTPLSTSCLDNPLLPTCHQCVNLNNGQPDSYVCAFTCRMGEQDCPTGQTCVAESGWTTGYQDCRNLTDGYEKGYCQ